MPQREQEQPKESAQYDWDWDTNEVASQSRRAVARRRAQPTPHKITPKAATKPLSLEEDGEIWL
jgi:hypothetical protein